MNASVRFREGKQPLVRLKLPLRSVGVQLAAGGSVGKPSGVELRLGSNLFGVSWCYHFAPSEPKSGSMLFKVPLGGGGGDALRLLCDWNLRARTVHLSLRFKPRLGSFTLRHGADERPGLPPTPEEIPSPPYVAASSSSSVSGGRGMMNGSGIPFEARALAPAGAPLTFATATAETAGARGPFFGADAWLHLHHVIPIAKDTWAKVRWALNVPSEAFFSQETGLSWRDVVQNRAEGKWIRLDKLSLVRAESPNIAKHLLCSSCQRPAAKHAMPPQGASAAAIMAEKQRRRRESVFTDFESMRPFWEEDSKKPPQTPDKGKGSSSSSSSAPAEKPPAIVLDATPVLANMPPPTAVAATSAQ
eukprot:jgi/Chlat1/6597/Chrsp46S09072